MHSTHAGSIDAGKARLRPTLSQKTRKEGKKREGKGKRMKEKKEKEGKMVRKASTTRLGLEGTLRCMRHGYNPTHSFRLTRHPEQ